MEFDFYEYDSLIIRIGQDGLVEQEFITSSHYGEIQEPDIYDIEISPLDMDLTLPSVVWENHEILERFTLFVSEYGYSIANLIKIWYFAKELSDTSTGPKSVTNQRDWNFAKPFPYGSLEIDTDVAESELVSLNKMISDCFELADQIKFASTVGARAKEFARERQGFLNLQIAEKNSNKKTEKRRRTNIAMKFKKIGERDGYICKRCETTIGLEVDHVIPFSKGGSDELENLQLLCRSCNAKKGAKIFPPN